MSSMSSLSNQRGVKYDPDYNDIVVFKVEDTIFRAFRSAFLHPGSIFQHELSLAPQTSGYVDVEDPDSPEGGVQGLSEENPILLEGITKQAFRCFLMALIPMYYVYMIYREGGQSPLEYEEWFYVLDLATMWKFSHIRKKAITALTFYVRSLTVGERIVNAWKYEVKSWAISACVEAASSPISRKALKEAGVDANVISGLYAVRDSAFVHQADDSSRHIIVKQGKCGAGHVCVEFIGINKISTMDDWIEHYDVVTEPIDRDHIRYLVREEFKEELNRMRDY